MRVALQHVDFVSAIRLVIDRVNAQRGPLRLQYAPQLVQPLICLARDDDGINLGIGQNFLEVRNHAVEGVETIVRLPRRME